MTSHNSIFIHSDPCLQVRVELCTLYSGALLRGKLIATHPLGGTLNEGSTGGRENGKRSKDRVNELSESDN